MLPRNNLLIERDRALEELFVAVDKLAETIPPPIDWESLHAMQIAAWGVIEHDAVKLLSSSAISIAGWSGNVWSHVTAIGNANRAEAAAREKFRNTGTLYRDDDGAYVFYPGDAIRRSPEEPAYRPHGLSGRWDRQRYGVWVYIFDNKPAEIDKIVRLPSATR